MNTRTFEFDEIPLGFVGIEGGTHWLTGDAKCHVDE